VTSADVTATLSGATSPDGDRGSAPECEPRSQSLAALQALLDPGSLCLWREAVGDGVIAGAARIRGRDVCVWTQDPTHRGGSLGVAGGDTIARTITRADRAGVPVIGVPRSGGARLQEGVAALSAYGAIFRAQATARVPQIAVIDGVCAGGAAYSPALGDLVIFSARTARMFLTGPRVVEQVTGERSSSEDLGGCAVHRANGVAHVVCSDDMALAEALHSLLSFLPSVLRGELPMTPVVAAPTDTPGAPLPSSARQIYDVRDVVRAISDGGEHVELAGRWARNMITTLARLGGHPVAIIANQPAYLGGAIDSAASEKGRWFVDLCDRVGLPVIAIVDTPGFLPGARQERAGVIRHGSDLLAAFARATVPKMTVTLRQAYGGAHIVMNSRDLGADLTLAWPGAQIGVMGARQAVSITERRAIAAGHDIDALARSYAVDALAVHAAAANGFVDEVVAPEHTRERLIRELELHA
jgi:acetyl-CoA carboxylase carboxyltransferase component